MVVSYLTRCLSNLFQSLETTKEHSNTTTMLLDSIESSLILKQLLIAAVILHIHYLETVTGHRSITFNLSYSSEKISAESAREQLVFHRANWTLYKTERNRLLKQRKWQEVFNEADLIDYNQFFTDGINRATDRSTPPAASFIRTNQVKTSKYTLDLIKRNHRLYRQLKKKKKTTNILE